MTWQTVGLALSSQQLDSHRHLRIIYIYIYLLGSLRDEPNLNKHESRLPLFVRDFLGICICIYYIFISYEKNHALTHVHKPVNLMIIDRGEIRLFIVLYARWRCPADGNIRILNNDYPRDSSLSRRRPVSSCNLVFLFIIFFINHLSAQCISKNEILRFS